MVEYSNIYFIYSVLLFIFCFSFAIVKIPAVKRAGERNVVALVGTKVCFVATNALVAQKRRPVRTDQTLNAQEQKINR